MRVKVRAGVDIPAGMQAVTFNDEGLAIRYDALGHHSLFNRFASDGWSFPEVKKGDLVEVVIPMQIVNIDHAVEVEHLKDSVIEAAAAEGKRVAQACNDMVLAAEKERDEAKAVAGRICGAAVCAGIVTISQTTDEVEKVLRALVDKLEAAQGTIAHMDQMDARRRKLCDDYEVRLRELGEMLGARERERPALIKSRDQLQNMAQFFEKEPGDLFDYFITIQDSLFNSVERAVNQTKALADLNRKVEEQAAQIEALRKDGPG